MVVQLGRIAGACDCLNFVTVMLLRKFVCPDSEICFESNLNERLVSLGFCENRVSLLDEVERRSTITPSMTYLVYHGKVLNEKRTIEENNIGTETTIDMSLRLLMKEEEDDGYRKENPRHRQKIRKKE